MGRSKKEPKEPKSYSSVPEADEIIKKLCDTYPEVLFSVNPSEVGVFGIDNQEPPKNSTKLAKITKVSGVMEAVLEKHKVGLKFLIELFWSDFHAWNAKQKSLILFHELCHIQNKDSTKALRKHTIEDFDLLVSILGVGGYAQENLPDLLGATPVKFDPALIKKLHEENIEEKDEEAPTPPEE